MRSSAFLIGACLLLAPAVSAQPIPVPAPAPKAKSVPPPPSSQGGSRTQLVPAQSGGGLFPFKIPGFGNPGTTTDFDKSQRALIDRVNIYLMSVQTMTGDFVQVG